MPPGLAAARVLGTHQGALPLSRRALLLLLGPALAGLILTGAAKDAGTGYRLENVEVMDPLMRLEDARRYMIRFNEALGVQCRDCHDLRDFASDEKELKLVAREMMKMEIEINETFFPAAEGAKGAEAAEGAKAVQAVTCWTCHRGQRIPPAESGLMLPGLGEAGLEGEDPDGEEAEPQG
jgi:hypothetical protein